jgi:hypothetical protein
MGTATPNKNCSTNSMVGGGEDGIRTHDTAFDRILA